MSDISDAHSEQLLNYLRFSRYKRDQQIREVEATFQETKDARLNQNDYSQDEVETLLNDLTKIVKANVQTEMLHAAHINVVLLKQLFGQAEKAGTVLNADTSALEDRTLLAVAKQLEDQSKSAEPLKGAAQMTPAAASKLPSLGGTEAAQANELNILKVENGVLKERLAKMQAQCTNILKEKTAIGNEMNALQTKFTELNVSVQNMTSPEATAVKEQAAAVGVSMSSVSKMAEPTKESDEQSQQLQASLDFTKKLLDAKERDFEELEKKLEDRVNNSSQFISLKKMLAQKNDQIKALRTSLRKYEPDDCPMAEDD